MRTSMILDAGARRPVAPPFSIPTGTAHRAFTLTELLVVLAMLALLTVTFVPALAHTKPNSLTSQCLNNLRQMTRAWDMYAQDYNGKIVSAYPPYGTFTGNSYFGWCAGTAESSGQPGSYSYGGSDPQGLQLGKLWPYIKAYGPYHCPTDNRRVGSSAPGNPNQPILRSISMNSFLAGASFGATPDFAITAPTSPRDPKHPVYLKASEISMPQATFVFIDEDQESINDSMILMDVSGTARFLDLPSRAHRFGYGISFADGHAEIYRFQDDASKNWHLGQPRPMGGYNDWLKLASVTTHPL